MTIFERVLGGNIFFDFWKQVQQYLFSEKKLIQLITLKPIEIYKTATSIEIDTAKINLQIKSTLENLMQRRIDRTINLLTLNLSKNQQSSFIYDFDILIKAHSSYKDVSNFFNFHFGNQTYEIEKDNYYLAIDQFTFSNKNTKAVVELPFVLDAKWKFIKRKLYGKAIFTGSINFHHPRNIVKTRNLNYELETKSIVLKFIDRFYHQQLIEFLHSFLQYNFKAELEHVKTEAQQQINSIQNQSNWMSGTITELDLERITIEDNGLHAVFLAKGKLNIL